jgi:hypothetical protein
VLFELLGDIDIDGAGLDRYRVVGDVENLVELGHLDDRSAVGDATALGGMIGANGPHRRRVLTRILHNGDDIVRRVGFDHHFRGARPDRQTS